MRDTREIEAIHAVQQGQTDQFAILYDTYARDIYKFVYFKTHHKETTEDLVSEIFVKVIKEIGRFDPQKASLKTWLYTIARHTVIDYYRGFHHERDLVDAWDLPSGEDIAEKTHFLLVLDKVKKDMRALTQDQRDVVVLRVWYGLSYAEIAEVLGTTAVNCRMIYSRAVARLGDTPLGVIFCLSFISSL